MDKPVNQNLIEYCFFYGTLLPGFVPEQIKSVVEQFTFVGEGSVFGRLYDFGNHPGAVLDAAAPSKIIGKVFSLPADETLQRQLLERLDEYEGYNPVDESACLFIRRRVMVTLPNGEKVESWIYVYQGDTSQVRLIASGNFAKRGEPNESL
jgi:gamma-glutamylcyclotransferase (GGCT)/AIG2-like uncharacterized protein YtfP